MSEPQAFNHRVTADQAAKIPEEIRNDPNERALWTTQALEIGLGVKIQSSATIDTALVRKELDHFKEKFFMDMNGWVGARMAPSKRASAPKSTAMGRLISRLARLRRPTRSNRLLKAIQKEIEERFGSIQNHLGMEAARKEEAEKGTRKGVEFEQEIANHLHASKGPTNDSIEMVGEAVIEGTRRKVGDILVDLDGPEGSDLKIVMEVKAGSNFTMSGNTSLPGQMKEAMDLRGAQACIAVIDVKHLPNRLKPYHVIDNHRILVAVDRENEDYTLLDIAFNILRQRLLEAATAPSSSVQSLDTGRIEGLINQIVSAFQVTGKMKKNATDTVNTITSIRSDIVNLETSVKAHAHEVLALLASATPTAAN